MADTPPTETTTADAAEPPPGKWQIVLILAVVLISIAVSQTVLRRGRDAEPPPAPDPQSDGATVTLIVDTGGAGQPQESPVAWAEGMTVLEALEAGYAAGVDRRGAGANAFVNAIGGVANEGGGGRNWQYFVNGERGGVGAGVKKLGAGDRVLWRFAPYE